MSHVEYGSSKSFYCNYYYSDIVWLSLDAHTSGVSLSILSNSLNFKIQFNDSFSKLEIQNITGNSLYICARNQSNLANIFHLNYLQYFFVHSGNFFNFFNSQF